jgi:HEAT repeat protein
MSSDPASLDEILRELRNPDSTIRAAALAAAIQFGSRDAIPTLAQAAMETEDGNEKTNILEAIEFLKLPSLSEVLTQTPPAAPVLPTGMSSKP